MPAANPGTPIIPGFFEGLLMAPTSKRLRYVFLRQNGHVEETVSTKTLVQRIQTGELSPDDEISAEGKQWVRLVQHSQLAPLFEKTPTPSEEAAEVPENTLAPEIAEYSNEFGAETAGPEEEAAAFAEDSTPAEQETALVGEAEQGEAAYGMEEASKGQRAFLLVMVALLFLILGYNLLVEKKPADNASKEAASAATQQPALPEETAAANPGVEPMPQGSPEAGQDVVKELEETPQAAASETPAVAVEEK